MGKCKQSYSSIKNKLTLYFSVKTYRLLLKRHKVWCLSLFLAAHIITFIYPVHVNATVHKSYTNCQENLTATWFCSGANTITNSITSDVLLNSKVTATTKCKSNNFSTYATNQIVAVTIIDLSGKTVYSAQFPVSSFLFVNIKLHPERKLIKGMYVVTLEMNGQKMTKKLVVE
jgi:hypothetical protein